MPGKKYECGGCKRMMRSDNLKIHKKICKRKEILDSPLRQEIIPQRHSETVGGIINNNPVKVPILGDIINKVVQGSDDMTIKPMTNKKPNFQPKKPVIPIKAINAVKPNSLYDIATHSGNLKSDSEETDSEENDESSEDEVEFMSDNSEELRESFRNLYEKLHRNLDHNIEIYNKLELMLNELERMGCLTKEECNSVKKCLQEKMGI